MIRLVQFSSSCLAVQTYLQNITYLDYSLFCECHPDIDWCLTNRPDKSAKIFSLITKLCDDYIALLVSCLVDLDKEWASERSERRDQFLLVTNNFISLLSFNELKITPQKIGIHVIFLKRENEGASKHRSQRPIERGMPISNVCISPILYKQCCHHPGCHCYPI